MMGRGSWAQSGDTRMTFLEWRLCLKGGGGSLLWVDLLL